MNFLSETGKFHVEKFVLETDFTLKEFKKNEMQYGAFNTHYIHLPTTNRADGLLYDLIFFTEGHGAGFDFPAASQFYKIGYDTHIKRSYGSRLATDNQCLLVCWFECTLLGESLC